MTRPSDGSAVLARQPLYEIAAEIVDAAQALSDFYDLPDEEQTPERHLEVFTAWKALTLRLEDKVEACAAVLREAGGWQDRCRAEIARLTGLLRASERKTEWLRNYTRDCMAQASVKKIGGVTRAATKPRVEIEEVAPADARTYLPADCVREKHEYLPDKTAILERWKLTGDVPYYVRIVEGESLRIK